MRRKAKSAPAPRQPEQAAPGDEEPDQAQPPPQPRRASLPVAPVQARPQASGRRPFVALSGMHTEDIRRHDAMLRALGVGHTDGRASHLCVF